MSGGSGWGLFVFVCWLIFVKSLKWGSTRAVKHEKTREGSAHQHFFWESRSFLQSGVGTSSACANVFLARDVSPCPATSSLTGIYFCSFTARVAFHIAAPMKFAVALPHSRVLVRVVTSAAAHQVAAVGLLGCLVAHPSLRSHAAGDRVFFTIIGGFFYVH